MKSATDLFEELRLWRNTVAETMHREPYMVLQNSVLLEIATKQPTSLAELRKLRGMGDAKVSQFGYDILAIVKGEVELPPAPPASSDPLSETVYTVSDLIESINRLLSFQQVVVQGEIGSIDMRGRYTFFTLLDPQENALINCFVWEDKLRSQGVELTEGMTVQVAGHPNIYKRTGRLTFEVGRVSLIGEGALKIAFERLKARLEGLGYFDIEQKKPLPPYIRRIGLITSSYADARKDFLTHLGNFGFYIDFYHIRVEGLYAVDDIKQAISWFNKQPRPVDVIVLTRGGGSLDSMQAFNNEDVASALFASKIPVLTGIGHENDLSIADLVADRFASTPTDAGRILSEDWRRLAELLSGYETFFTSRVGGLMALTSERLSVLGEKLTRLFTITCAAYAKQLLDLKQEFTISLNRTLFQTEQKILASENLLKAHDPLHRLRQGYSIVRNDHGNVVKSSRSLTKGDKVHILFGDGSADTEIKNATYGKQ